MKTTATAAMLLFALYASSAGLRASQIHVPADFSTIQGAVDAAGAFDTVVVAPGTYTENVIIQGKATRLASHFLLDGNLEHLRETIIDGSNPVHADSASVIRLINAGDALVLGFTLTGGAGTLFRDVSDGLLYREGGAILTEGGTPRIYDNLIIANSAADRTGAKSAGGGGIRCGYGSADIRHNVIAYNTGRYGGGIVLFHNDGVLKNNIFYRNAGGEDFGGGGIWATSAGGTHTFENNTIVENRSVLDGGGILLWANAATMANNIIWGNTAGIDPQVRLRSGAAASTVSYSDVEGGFGGTANIALPPLFFSSNLYLDLLSPCVDAGSPAVGNYDPADPVDGSLALAPARGTRHNDMGAYGGPGMRDFPLFNAPGIATDVSSAELGTVPVAQSGTLWLRVSKTAYGLARIDSVLWGGDPLGALDVETALPVSMGPSPADSLDSLKIIWTPNTYGDLQDTLFIYHSDGTVTSPIVIALSGTAPGTTGDVNFDGVMTSGDIIYLVNYTFKGGPPPQPVPAAGDVNCDGNVTSADIIFMVNFVFKSGPGPCS